MPRIYVLSGPDVGKSFDVVAGATIGRAPECAVPLRDASVSRQHARLDVAGSTWRVVDLGSRNGLRVDGQRADSAPLADGGEFVLGEVLLRFRADDRAADRLTDGVTDGGTGTPARASAPPARAPAEEPQEIVLEGAWDDAPTVAHSAPPRAPEPPPRAAPTELTANERHRERLARAGALPKEGAGARGILQYQRVEQRDGFARAELGQQPLWIRALVLLGALAIFAAVFWFAFRGTSWLRGDPAPDPTVVEEPEAR